MLFNFLYLRVNFALSTMPQRWRNVIYVLNVMEEQKDKKYFS